VFINLETDPCILHSSPRCACVNLPPPTAFGLLLTSALRLSALAVLSIRLSEILVCLTAIPYSCILTPLGAPCLSVLRVLGTPLRCPLGRLLGHPCLIPSYKLEPAPLDPVRTSVPVHVILVSTSPNPCHPTPLGHPGLIPSYKFEPAPSDPIRTSVLVRITIRTLVIQLRSGVHLDICVSLHLTSSSPCLRGLFRPPSLSVL
jgi:hypothetical protein